MNSPSQNPATEAGAMTPLTADQAASAILLLGQSLDFPEADQIRHCAQAALVIHRGRIAWQGPAVQLPVAHQAFAEVIDYGNAYILPGFIDTHVHAAQMPVIGSWGEQLLDWLNRYTFPAERRFEDPVVARQQSELFLDALLAHGTTTAMVFGTVHEAATDALFKAAQERRMALIAGKVLMDRNCPDYLSDSAGSGFDASARLIRRWHGTDRLHYAITPRFAPTSTEAQLERAGALQQEATGLYLQTHVSENPQEVRWVQSLFPDSKDYVGVYQQYGLLHDRTVLAHGLHLTDREWSVLSEHQSRIAVCPTSNTFLGSGLFDFARAWQEGVPLGLASDVGGGTSLSQLVSAAEAYKVGQLQGCKLTVSQLWHMMTLGNARALHLDAETGTLDRGKMADLVVLDTTRSANLTARLKHAESIDEALFATLILGDERLTRATWVAGERRYGA